MPQEAAEEARQAEMQRRFAAENERRRRIDRIRRSRDGESGGSGGAAAQQKVNRSVNRARKKKLEKAVSTYMSARLLRMPRSATQPHVCPGPSRLL